ncbi:2,4'-dihydroxyacetophenone dioxygenase family protein [Streptomyces sp. NPDC059080]|uniref:2,4'-dihydroxyacetophenone dioxygenase family protein n=1 Tax=Streptomyces sp. NPDC059080 TaxID=3346718 RepID=UPI0036B3846C
MTTSPPPGADSPTAIEARTDRSRDRYALPEGHIAEAASPWLPFGPQVMIKHLTFDIRSNSAANVLWVQAGGPLGRHRHRGPVSGYVLDGSWRYLECDWVGRPGDFIRESPGRTHTL